jgi:hypothetical protein
LIAASVRLRIQDPQGHSCGSGTIIDARGGEALILTCGHLFRDSDGNGKIEVDLFGPQHSRRVPGRLIAYDLKSDVGLVAIRTPGPVVTARVAPRGYNLSRGQTVVSVGCDNGADPTAKRSCVNSLNKFLGPANVQVAGQPIEGRSGGGLFSADGFVVGVCNAADPEDQEGLFAAVDCIHAALDESDLSYVYDPAKSGPQLPEDGSQPDLVGAGPLVAVNPPPATRGPGRQDGPNRLSVPVRTVSATRGELPGLNRGEEAALAELRRRMDEGCEVICIIRPRNDPQAKSDVLVLDGVSPDFLQHLEAVTKKAEMPRLTSSKQPR